MRTILITADVKIDIAELTDTIRITAYNVVAILSGKSAQDMRGLITEADSNISDDPSYSRLQENVEDYMVKSGEIEWDDWEDTYVSIAEAEHRIEEMSFENEHRAACADQKNYR